MKITRIIQGFILALIILEFIVNWNIDYPSLLILSYTHLGLFSVLNKLEGGKWI